MADDNDQTNSPEPEFDPSAYPREALVHDRRSGRDRRDQRDQRDAADAGPTGPAPQGTGERRAKKERRRRIDPTTFEKQYTEEEMEFMKAMQRFKELSGQAFPTYGDVLKVAVGLGYRKAVVELEPFPEDLGVDESFILLAPTVEQRD
jgi:hypothetical protein